MIKKVWFTNKSERGEPMYVMSLESEQAEPEHMRLHVRDMAFPLEPTPEHPRRHTVTIALLDIYDLIRMRDALNIQIKLHERK